MASIPVRVTLRDIASRVGVHYSTVSLALRGQPGVPEATRMRIRAVAAELGYHPDPMLAALSRYRRHPRREKYQATLAWVTNFPERNGWRKEEIYQEYHGGAKERAAQLGFRLQEFWLQEERMTSARASQILAARGIAGLVMAPQPTASEAVELEWDRFVAVTIGYSLIRPQLHMVCPNQYRCMKLAMTEVIDRDYRRIGLVMLRESDERVDHNWLAGYFVGQQALAPENRLEPLLLPKWDERLVGQWLRRCRPDAIISKCAQTLPALRRLGYELPRDLGLVSLTQVRSTRGLTGVDESPQEVGAAAVEYLFGMLQRNERGVPGQPRRLLIEGRWCEGGTLRPLAGAA